jgi:hypothetical protein
LANGLARIEEEFGESQTTSFPQQAIHYSRAVEGARGEPSSHAITPQKRGFREPFGAGLVPLSPVAVAPSLDYSVKSCDVERSRRDGTLVGWVRYALDPEGARRRRGRAFHRFLSGIKRCRHLERDVYFLTLTSSKERGYEFLKRDWIVLLKRCREFFGQFDYCMIKTHEGNGVIHLLFHSEWAKQFRYDALHSFFSVNWAEIHCAEVVWIRKTYGDKRLAGYLTQYLSSQEGETRMSWSWGWVHRGFVHDWEEVKRSSESIRKAIQVWDWYLQNEDLWLKCRLDKLRKPRL